MVGVDWVSSPLGFGRMRSRVMPGGRVDSGLAWTAGSLNGPAIVNSVAMMPSRPMAAACVQIRGASSAGTTKPMC